MAAGLDVGSELLEGAELVRQAEPHARGDDHGRLASFAEALGDPAADRAARGYWGALPTELLALMATYGQPEGLTHGEGEYPGPRGLRPTPAFAAWYEFFPRSATDDPARHGTFADAERGADPDR